MANEYINAKDLQEFRDELMDKFLSLCNYNDFNKLTLLRIGETIDEVYDKYNSLPLADVEEVKHGHWIKVGKTNGGSNILQCSVCGTVRKGVAKTRFCKDCGAKMDGGDKL